VRRGGALFSMDKRFNIRQFVPPEIIYQFNLNHPILPVAYEYNYAGALAGD
jgi:hypothetical protein